MTSEDINAPRIINTLFQKVMISSIFKELVLVKHEGTFRHEWICTQIYMNVNVYILLFFKVGLHIVLEKAIVTSHKKC